MDRIIHQQFNQQAVYRRGSKLKTAYLTSVLNVAIWFYHSLVGSETTAILFK